MNSHANEFARTVASVGGRPPSGGGGQFSDFISFGVYKRIGGGGGIEVAARDAFLAGLNQILVYAGILALVGAVLSLALVRPRDFVQHG